MRVTVNLVGEWRSNVFELFNYVFLALIFYRNLVRSKFFFAELGVVSSSMRRQEHIFVNVYFEKFAFVVLYLMQLFPT